MVSTRFKPQVFWFFFPYFACSFWLMKSDTRETFYYNVSATWWTMTSLVSAPMHEVRVIRVPQIMTAIRGNDHMMCRHCSIVCDSDRAEKCLDASLLIPASALHLCFIERWSGCVFSPSPQLPSSRQVFFGISFGYECPVYDAHMYVCSLFLNLYFLHYNTIISVHVHQYFERRGVSCV